MDCDTRSHMYTPTFSGEIAPIFVNHMFRWRAVSRRQLSLLYCIVRWGMYSIEVVAANDRMNQTSYLSNLCINVTVLYYELCITVFGYTSYYYH